MSLGATHYNWRHDVLELVQQLRRRYPAVTVNTYYGHPWPGWDGRSFDVWGAGGRGDAIALDTGRSVVRFLMRLPGTPWIRHWIFLHELWTSWHGYSYWPANDHSGDLRHVHVTYW